MIPRHARSRDAIQFGRRVIIVDAVQPASNRQQHHNLPLIGLAIESVDPRDGENLRGFICTIPLARALARKLVAICDKYNPPPPATVDELVAPPARAR